MRACELCVSKRSLAKGWASSINMETLTGIEKRFYKKCIETIDILIKSDLTEGYISYEDIFSDGIYVNKGTSIEERMIPGTIGYGFMAYNRMLYSFGDAESKVRQHYRKQNLSIFFGISGGINISIIKLDRTSGKRPNRRTKQRATKKNKKDSR